MNVLTKDHQNSMTQMTESKSQLKKLMKIIQQYLLNQKMRPQNSLRNLFLRFSKKEFKHGKNRK